MPPTKTKPKKSTPLSLRVPADLQARVESYATDHGLKYRAALIALVELGLRGDTPERPDPKAVLAAAVAGAAHLGATPKKRERTWKL